DRRQGPREIPGDRKPDAALRRRRSGAGSTGAPAQHAGREVDVLYHLLYPFHTQFGALNVTRYITFRTAAASLSALAISLLLGPWLVRKLGGVQIGQAIKQEGPTPPQ